jgi:hypothetical protein
MRYTREDTTEHAPHTHVRWDAVIAYLVISAFLIGFWVAVVDLLLRSL